MNGHVILLLIAIICELGAAGIGFFYPAENNRSNLNLMALGFLFFFISMLVPAA